MKKDYRAVGVGERADGTYSVNTQLGSDKVTATSDATGNGLSVCHTSLAQVDWNSIKKMTQSGDIRGVEMT